MTARRSRIGLILTGGTIDSLGLSRLDLGWYIEAGLKLPAADLLARVPELDAIADVEQVPFRRLPSHALASSDWLDLLRLLETLLEQDGYDAVVVTHGTNTLEETAYFLHLALKTNKPVVLTGAMRPASAVSADGYLNLINAVRVAAEPASHGRGCLVVMNDTIFDARHVTKASTYRVEAFDGRDVGPLGFADADGRVVYYHRADRTERAGGEFALAGLEVLPRVDVVVSYVGADGAMIRAAAAAGARGIVSAGTGAGRPTPAEDDAFDEIHRDSGVLMCLCSRVGSGRSVRSPGLARRGFVAGDNLQPWKARVLLSLALTKTAEPDAVQRLFDTF
ncbi:MAG: hypothetical protein JWQ36_2539 [Enterovirga sp.]|nr:hypothetical protein [Enterovirga sp.]